MPIDSKECFAALTEDGQLWEIYQAAQTGGGGGGSPTGPAGGDLAGTYPNPTVDGLQGNPVSNATPTNGQVLQFDGTSWVPGSIPSGGSGGGGVVYFLNFNTAADTPVANIPQTPNASKELGITAETTATSFTSAILSTASYDFLASFVTDLNVPSATAIPAGLWDFNIWAESTTTNAANHILYKIEVLKYDGVNAPVLLATSADIYIYDPQDITQYVTSVVLPQTTILATDRIVVYLYGRATQNNNTITFRFGGQYPTHVHSTMPSVTGTGVVKVVNGVFQSPASQIVDADVSATANIAQSKIANLTSDLSGKVNKSGDTMTGKLIAAASSTEAKLNIGGNTTAPTTRVAGDMWLNGNRLNIATSATDIGQMAQLSLSNAFTNSASVTFASSLTPSLSALNATGTSIQGTSAGTLPAIRGLNNGTGTAANFGVDNSGLSVVISNASDLGSGLKVLGNNNIVLENTGAAVGNLISATDGQSPAPQTLFVVDRFGRVGIRRTPDSAVGLFLDSTGVKFNDNTIQTTAAVTSVGGVAPITSSGGLTPTISTSMATNRLLGRTSGGTGTAEEVGFDSGITMSAAGLRASTANVFRIRKTTGTFNINSSGTGTAILFDNSSVINTNTSLYIREETSGATKIQVTQSGTYLVNFKLNCSNFNYSGFAAIEILTNGTSLTTPSNLYERVVAMRTAGNEANADTIMLSGASTVNLTGPFWIAVAFVRNNPFGSQANQPGQIIYGNGYDPYLEIIKLY